ncbi:MAG: transcriptional repressor LexA [Schwartzia sp.]|nr:transcriptional repressor LexA [Schwartzia sp. (in: firmicutes)]
MKTGRKNQTASQRQESILKYIKEFTQNHSYPPTVREIGAAVGLKSSSTVQKYLTCMEERGVIERDRMKPRSIELPGAVEMRRTTPVPLVGDVAAGTPILAEQNIESTYPMPTDLLGTQDETFMLTVHGESMINVGILDGDYVIVRQQDTADDGEIVVALVNGEEATVKRIFFEKDAVKLKPENDNMEPFYEKDVKVLGKVIGLYRQM